MNDTNQHHVTGGDSADDTTWCPKSGGESTADTEQCPCRGKGSATDTVQCPRRGGDSTSDTLRGPGGKETVQMTLPGVPKVEDAVPLTLPFSRERKVQHG